MSQKATRSEIVRQFLAASAGRVVTIDDVASELHQHGVTESYTRAVSLLSERRYKYRDAEWVSAGRYRYKEPD